MSTNREKPHVFVFPEDDANLQIASEFKSQLDINRQHKMRVLDVAGGWLKVLDIFQSVHVAEMNRWPERFMVLLIDLDGDDGRMANAKAQIPAHLSNRVFIVSTLTEPEFLKPDLGSYETIASKLATDCHEGTDAAWGHRLLRHNADEITRLREYVRPFLFP